MLLHEFNRPEDALESVSRGGVCEGIDDRDSARRQGGGDLAPCRGKKRIAIANLEPGGDDQHRKGHGLGKLRTESRQLAGGPRHPLIDGPGVKASAIGVLPGDQPDALQRLVEDVHPLERNGGEIVKRRSAGEILLDPDEAQSE